VGAKSEDAEFQVEIDASDSAVTLTVRGDIDIATVSELESARAEALAREPRKLMIDLAQVGFVDSSGVKFLIDTQRRAAREGWQLALRRPPEPAMKVFVITGADRYLPFVKADG
jgi:anti-anti-sigma factor